MNGLNAKIRSKGARVAAALLPACALVMASLPVAAPLPARAADGAPAFQPVGAPTTVPFGWADFCRRYQGACDAGPAEALDVVAAPRTMKEIDRVNRWVNAHVEAVTDMDHFGVIDRWDYPTDGRGDCEDYALLKRKILMEEGFPRQALLMTVVKDSSDQGHAVLTVKTTTGDYVLDNLNNDVKPWTRTPYRFVKRQSQEDQNAWVQIGDPTSEPAYVSRDAASPRR
ncbi:transglutaminase-like cysteine peptidase [Methylocella sp.]|uniref:transglutaminase-like cysteine peptidase n=1 Tax=Methylocella sp. TaxID=1978226 RepID=UPI0037836D8E